MNCHAQIWTNAQLLEPVRQSWATGQSIPWIRVHDLPDFVYFNHAIHVNKGIGCETCHGRVDQMPLMYAQNTLQMEWCLDCHRNPVKNLRPTSEIYNMAWKSPSDDRPVWCATADGKVGEPTAQSVDCTTKNPDTPGGAEMATLDMATPPVGVQANALGASAVPASLHYEKFTSQEQLGRFLVVHYNIRNSRDLMSCEVCHR
jgi:hypothetical protein